MIKNKIDNVVNFVSLLRYSYAFEKESPDYLIEKFDKIIGTDLNVLNSEQIEYLKRFKIYNEHVKIWGGDRSKVDSILYFIIKCFDNNIETPSKMIKLLKTLCDVNMINDKNTKPFIHQVIINYIDNNVKTEKIFERDYKILSIIGFDNL